MCGHKKNKKFVVAPDYHLVSKAATTVTDCSICSSVLRWQWKTVCKMESGCSLQAPHSMDATVMLIYTGINDSFVWTIAQQKPCNTNQWAYRRWGMSHESLRTIFVAAAVASFGSWSESKLLAYITSGWPCIIGALLHRVLTYSKWIYASRRTLKSFEIMTEVSEQIECNRMQRERNWGRASENMTQVSDQIAYNRMQREKLRAGVREHDPSIRSNSV